MAQKKVSELDSTNVASSADLLDISVDNGDTTYTSKKITMANVFSNITTNVNLNKEDPEIRITDTGDDEYSRLTRSDTNKKMLLRNRVDQPAGDPVAVEFNGSSQYITIGDYNDYDFGSGNFSISAWVQNYAPTDYSLRDIVISKDDSSTQRQFFLLFVGDGVSTTKLRIAYFDTVATPNMIYLDSNPNPITDTNWHHIVGQRNGNSFDIFLDSVKIKNGTTAGSHATMKSSTAPLTIAYRSYATYEDYWYGKIDDVQLFSKALSQDDVDTIYNSGSGIYANLSVSPWNSNLVGLWRLDENTGTNADDEGSGGHDGTLAGSPVWTTGKVPLSSSTAETQIISSQDGVLGGEKGITTFGDNASRTVIDGKTIRVNINGSEKFQVDTSGNVIFPDNTKIYFGTSSDSSVYYDGTNLVINPKDVGSGVVNILGASNVVASYTGGYMVGSTPGGIYVPRNSDAAAVDYDVDDFTTDNTWRDLDLSSIVPSGAKAVCVRVQVYDGAAASALRFRKNGNSNDVEIYIIRTQVINVQNDGVAIISLDANRVIEYKGDNLAFSSISFHVMGWFI